MSDICADVQSKPVTPGAGQAVWYVDTYAKTPFVINDTGRCYGRSWDSAVADQAGFASDTYVTNSQLIIPSCGLQVGAQIKWKISVSKTAAGVATPIYQIRIGSNQSTADTSRLTMTGPAQTANGDSALIEIVLTVRSVGATGVIQGTVYIQHRNTATGFATNVNGISEDTSAGFDNSALGGQYIGLSINGGASAAWTVTQVQVEANW